MVYQLPNLPYSYDALEPVISREIMELHHQKHHNAYVTNLNASIEKYQEAEKKQDINEMIFLQSAIKFNGGGHINHSLFWENLAPVGDGGEPQGDFLKALEKSFGSLESFIAQMNTKSAAVQGSGWGWLGMHPEKKSLHIMTFQNQDPASSRGHIIPLLGIDVWEHAYYLQYKNARPEYLKAIWQVINWKTVNERFEKGMNQ